MLFVLGLGTKEIIVTLPIIVVLYLWIESPKKHFQKFLPELVVIFIPLIIYLLYRYMLYGDILIIRTDPYSHLIDRGLYFLTQIKVVVSYYLLKLSDINFQFKIIDALASNHAKIASYKRGLTLFNQLKKELNQLKTTQEKAKEQYDYNLHLFEELNNSDKQVSQRALSAGMVNVVLLRLS